MILRRRPRTLPLALTADPRITARVRRLVAVSVVALGLIWTLAVQTLELPELVEEALAIGWVLMPVVLAASLGWPVLRYLLVVPATLETVALVALVVTWLPANPVAAVGWILITGGIVLGGTLGLWLWYDLLPVPPRLENPLAAARWGLIAVHVALVVSGVVLASTPLWTT